MKYHIGAIQLSSKLDYKINLERIESYISELKNKGVDKIFLPECFYSYTDGNGPTPYLVDFGNEHFKNIQNLAKKFQVYLLGGSVAFNVENGIKNRVLNFSPSGELINFYDKIHLFACDIKQENRVLRIAESSTYLPGKELVVTNVEDLKIGNSICFDMRFSEMYHQYRQMQANLLTVSSAFTVPTGRAHWHTLLRARAIETQMFLVAAAQVGQNNEKMETYGHSLIISPWGEILADAGEKEGVIFAQIDLAQIDEVRSKVIMF